eukprot:CAMPEP_0181244854 /NCGR_PEP_ID=MMETSP1096-20121128/43094_1 /TAXON_ID=156174 ORGANISM="Chrysochromulina ericina, Strain CCMP281" /NCGR_SAMPLE_ID=MMETSP1096 /ASSEMBLY_ACC=CAM_ASM_000453 /LENGTH=206 /DNA_ID=CAMNT_0023341455 /DNA_START=451 /DNA_END=1071 /DNA_ORIENTATION=+
MDPSGSLSGRGRISATAFYTLQILALPTRSSLHLGSLHPGSLHPRSLDPRPLEIGSLDPRPLHPRSLDPRPLHPGSLDPRPLHPGSLDPGQQVAGHLLHTCLSRETQEHILKNREEGLAGCAAGVRVGEEDAGDRTQAFLYKGEVIRQRQTLGGSRHTAGRQDLPPPFALDSGQVRHRARTHPQDTDLGGRGDLHHVHCSTNAPFI